MLIAEEEGFADVFQAGEDDSDQGLNADWV
jgi:hypothetical protein